MSTKTLPKKTMRPGKKLSGTSPLVKKPPAKMMGKTSTGKTGKKALPAKVIAKTPVAKKPIAKKPIAKKPIPKKPISKKQIEKKKPRLASPVHHIPMRTEFNSPFSAAFIVEGGRTLFFSGCGPIPIYHRHPHDPVEEAAWLPGDFRAQCEKTFQNIGTILTAAGGGWASVIKLNIYLTDMREQNVLNEISAQVFGTSNPPARTLVAVPELAHPDMMLEIEGIAVVPSERTA